MLSVSVAPAVFCSASPIPVTSAYALSIALVNTSLLSPIMSASGCLLSEPSLASVTVASSIVLCSSHGSSFTLPGSI